MALEEKLFPDTRWTLVVNAREGGAERAESALAELCQSYWYPLYACARRSGLAPSDAEDCVQGLLSRMLAKRSFETVSKDRGRLRAFLQTSIRNFLTQEWVKGQRQKRGGGVVHLSIDQQWGEQQLQNEPMAADSPEAEFDRSWAYNLLHKVFGRLEAHYEKSGKLEIYQTLKGCLKGEGRYDSSVAESLGLSAEGLRSMVFKLRRRFREYIEEEVRETCADEADAKEEIRYLCQVLAT